MKLKYSKSCQKKLFSKDKLKIVFFTLVLLFCIKKGFAFDPHWAKIVGTDQTDKDNFTFLLDEKEIGVGTRLLKVNDSQMGTMFKNILLNAESVFYDKDVQLTVGYRNIIKVKLQDGRIIDISDVVKEEHRSVFISWNEYQKRIKN